MCPDLREPIYEARNVQELKALQGYMLTFFEQYRIQGFGFLHVCSVGSNSEVPVVRIFPDPKGVIESIDTFIEKPEGIFRHCSAERVGIVLGSTHYSILWRNSTFPARKESGK